MVPPPTAGFFAQREPSTCRQRSSGPADASRGCYDIELEQIAKFVGVAHGLFSSCDGKAASQKVVLQVDNDKGASPNRQPPAEGLFQLVQRDIAIAICINECMDRLMILLGDASC